MDILLHGHAHFWSIDCITLNFELSCSLCILYSAKFWCFPARPSKFNPSSCLKTIEHLQVYGERQWPPVKIFSIKYMKSQYPSKFPPSKFCAIRYIPSLRYQPLKLDLPLIWLLWRYGQTYQKLLPPPPGNNRLLSILWYLIIWPMFQIWMRYRLGCLMSHCRE